MVEVRTAVPAGLGVAGGLVVLREEVEPHRFLRIIIGQPEARAIQAAIQGSVPERPGTWDLFVSAVAMLDAQISRVLITAVEEERHFYAALEMEQGGQRRRISCRPSDAIALAVRVPSAGIFAEEEVLAAAGRLADGTAAPPRDRREEGPDAPLP